MQNVFQILIVAMGLSMFKLKRLPIKFSFLIISEMLFSLLHLSYIPVFNTSNSYLIICFVFSEFKNLRSLFVDYSGTIILSLFTILLFLGVYTIVISPHLNVDINSIRLYAQNRIVCVYFVLLLSFMSVKDDNDLTVLLNVCYPFLCFFFIIGLLNYVTKYAFWVDILVNSVDDDSLGHYYTEDERFRTQGTFSLGCTYGFFNVIVFLLYLYGYLKKLCSRQVILTSLAFSFIGIFISGFRTCFITLFVGLMCFTLYAFDFKKCIKISFGCLIVVLFFYISVPFIQNVVDNILTVFTDTSGDEVEGSSISLRLVQLEAVLSHIQDKPLIGNGVGYFLIDLGWGDKGIETLKDVRLYGLESILFSLLLERGVIGVIIFSIFVVKVFRYFWVNRFFNPYATGIGASIISSFFVFSVATGEQGSLLPTLLSIGLFIRLVYESRNEF